MVNNYNNITFLFQTIDISGLAAPTAESDQQQHQQHQETKTEAAAAAEAATAPARNDLSLQAMKKNHQENIICSLYPRILAQRCLWGLVPLSLAACHTKFE